jgi:DNA-directed RNA polymerase subunit alpha
MSSISLPKSPIYKETDDRSGQLIIEECFPRYGATLGNSLRRVLLSSLEGNAIVSVKIKGATHEFSSLDGVVEDVVQIILNLKSVSFKMEDLEEATVFLKVKGKKDIYAKDFETSSEVEVVTPDVHIATISNSSTTLEMEVKIKKGMGYVPVEQQESDKEIGTIMVDAIYNPVKRVNFTIENMRVGKRTDYERVILDIVTDGSMTPEEAYHKSVAILLKQFGAITTIEDEEDTVEDVENSEEAVDESNDTKKIDVSSKKKVAKVNIVIADLKLPARTASVLEDNKIETVDQIEEMAESDLLALDGMGEKGVKEIRKAIGGLGIILKAEEK